MSHSLPEQLTVCGLLSLVLGLGLQVLVPCLRLWDSDQARSGRDQAYLVASLRLQRDLRASDGQGVSTTGTALAVPEATEHYDPRTGQPLFENYAVYYRRNNCLMRKTWPRNAGALRPLTQLELQAALADTTRTEQTVARQVARFSATMGRTVDVELALDEHAPLRFSVEPRL